MSDANKEAQDEMAKVGDQISPLDAIGRAGLIGIIVYAIGAFMGFLERFFDNKRAK